MRCGEAHRCTQEQNYWHLGGGEGVDLVHLLGDDDGGVGLQVEVLLAAHTRLALQHVVAVVAGEHCLDVAAVQAVVPVLQHPHRPF